MEQEKKGPEGIPPTPKSRRRGLVLNILVLLIAVVVIGVTVNYFYKRMTYTYTDDASVKQNVVPVNCRVGGFIDKIYFDEFSEVKKGDTLLVVNSTDYVIRLNQAQAGLQNALANEVVMNTTVSTLKNAQDIAHANLKEVEVQLQNAEKNYKRYQKLLAEKSVTQTHFDQVETQYKSLKARRLAMQKSYNGAKLATTEAKARLKASQAGIKSAQVGVSSAKQDMIYTIVLAPCDGFTGRKTVNLGQLLQTGQTIVQIVENDKKWITANFLEKQAEDLQLGAKVNIEIDAFSDTDFKGTISSIAGATGSVFSLVPTDNATGNFVKVQQRIPVRISFDDNTPKDILKQLRAGMNAEIYVKH